MQNFLKATEFLTQLIEGAVKPKNVVGFVYSFFYNRVFPSEPLQLRDDILTWLPRSSKLYERDTKEIILTKEEVDYINNKLFDEKLQESYNQLFQALDMFHRHFKDAIDPENLIETYKSLLLSLESGGEASTFSKFNSVNELDINYFKSQVVNQLFDFTEAIKEKINSLQKTIYEIFPSDIFTKVEYYIQFKKYQAKYIQNPYNDYSFLFKRMAKLKMVHRKTFDETLNWLSKEGYIDNQSFKEIYEKGSFNTKAESKERMRNFSIVFENE